MAADDACAGRRPVGIVRDSTLQRTSVDEYRAVRARRELLERRHDRGDRCRHQHRIRGQKVLEAGCDPYAVGLRSRTRALVGVVPRDVVPVAKREGQRATDEAEPNDADLHGAATPSVRPTARATCGTAAMSARKLSNVKD